MSQKESPKDVIEAYRKQQARSQRMPKIIFWSFVVIILLVAVGFVLWFTGDQKPNISLNLFASETPTATNTVTSSPTITPSATPTLTEPPTPTETPTITLTPTRSGPFIYVVEEGDTLTSIALEFELEILVIVEANQERLGLDPANPIIRVGDELLIPPPGTQLSTPTPLPEGLPPGTRIEYMVQSGDTLAAIAAQFNSTVEDILDKNELEDPNSIFIGQILIIRVNLVTPVPTAAPAEDASPTPEG